MEGNDIVGSQFSVNSGNLAQNLQSSSADSGVDSAGSHSVQSILQQSGVWASNLSLELPQGLSNGQLNEQAPSSSNEEIRFQRSPIVTGEMSPIAIALQLPPGSVKFAHLSLY